MLYKVCVISVQFGYVGLLASPTGLANMAHTHNRTNQILLDPTNNYSEQISTLLNEMIRESIEYHNKCATVDKNLGSVVSHSIAIIDHHE